MKVVIFPIMFNFRSLAFHPLLNLDRTGDFSTNGWTSLLVPNQSCAFMHLQDICGNAVTYMTYKYQQLWHNFKLISSLYYHTKQKYTKTVSAMAGQSQILEGRM